MTNDEVVAIHNAAIPTAMIRSAGLQRFQSATRSRAVRGLPAGFRPPISEVDFAKAPIAVLPCRVLSVAQIRVVLRLVLHGLGL